ncbi:MAG TPA: enoyl-CoA hydratase-related protein, partial [Dehalococcoidia bacterium]|nr:enoyl-CoA hydratase-related protein [Dehalococcoidia bacterium]
VGMVGAALHKRLEDYLDDEGLWCAVVTGAGMRAFSAGADLKRFGERRGPRAPVWERRTLDLISGAEFWKPIVAAVNGHAIGAGAMLALACDLRVASDNATFGIPEVKYGSPPGMGSTQRLPRAIPLGPAMEMLLTGDRITAEQAYHWGVFNRVVAQPELMDAAMNIAKRITANPPLAVRATKEAIMRGLDLSLEQGLRLESLLSFPTRHTEDFQEAIHALAEKRPAAYKAR